MVLQKGCLYSSSHGCKLFESLGPTAKVGHVNAFLQLNERGMAWKFSQHKTFVNASLFVFPNRYNSPAKGSRLRKRSLFLVPWQRFVRRKQGRADIFVHPFGNRIAEVTLPPMHFRCCVGTGIGVNPWDLVDPVRF